MPDDELSAAERLEKDPRPKGEPVERGPVMGAGTKAEAPLGDGDEAEPAPWTPDPETRSHSAQ